MECRYIWNIWAEQKIIMYLNTDLCPIIFPQLFIAICISTYVFGIINFHVLIYFYIYIIINC